MQLQLTPKDLNFVGYTYKNFDAVKGLRQAFGKQLLLPSHDDWSMAFYLFSYGMGEDFRDSQKHILLHFCIWLVIILFLLEQSFLSHLYIHHLSVCLFLSITLYTVLENARLIFSAQLCI